MVYLHIINFREQPPSSRVKAYFDIDFGYISIIPGTNTRIIFKNWSVVPTKTGGYFVSGPRFKASQESKFYEDYIKIEGDVKSFYDQIKELVSSLIN